MGFIILPIIVLCFLLFTKNTNSNGYDHDTGRQQETIIRKEESNIPKRNNYAQAYQAKYLLTRNEWYEFKKLKKYAAELNIHICPKVRLLDLVEPRKGEKYMSYLGKIQSKHVDFVLCDQDLRIKAILELDDNSHNQQDRKERDLFVDEVLQSVGYRVIRTRSITEATLDPLKPAKPTEPAETITQ